MIERQQVHAAEQAGERPLQQPEKLAKSSAGQSINVGHELDLIFQKCAASSRVQFGIAPCRLATIAPTRFANVATSRSGQFKLSPCMKAAANASPAPTVSATSTVRPRSST